RALPPEEPVLARRLVLAEVIGHPADAPARPDERLVAKVGEARGGDELVLERAGERAPVRDEEREPLRAGDVRGGLGRKRRGVDGDGGAALEEEARRGQPDGAAAEDGDATRARFEDDPGGEVGGPPREGHAAAPVAVVVDEELVAELVGADDEARRAEGPKADDGADLAAGIDAHRRNDEARLCRARWCRRHARTRARAEG